MPKLIDHRAREVELAEAAWRVVRSQGVRGLSVRQVAAEAGLAVGSLRRSFPTQQALWAFCVDLVAQRCEARIEALDPAMPDYAVAVLSEALPLDEERRLEMQVWLALSLEALSDPELRRVCDALDASLADLAGMVIERLAAAGKLVRGADLQLEAQRLHSLLDGVAIHLLRQPADASTAWGPEVLRRHIVSLRSGGI